MALASQPPGGGRGVLEFHVVHRGPLRPALEGQLGCLGHASPSAVVPREKGRSAQSSGIQIKEFLDAHSSLEGPAASVFFDHPVLLSLFRAAGPVHSHMLSECVPCLEQQICPSVSTQRAIIRGCW